MESLDEKEKEVIRRESVKIFGRDSNARDRCQSLSVATDEGPVELVNGFDEELTTDEGMSDQVLEWSYTKDLPPNSVEMVLEKNRFKDLTIAQYRNRALFTIAFFVILTIVVVGINLGLYFYLKTDTYNAIGVKQVIVSSWIIEIVNGLMVIAMWFEVFRELCCCAKMDYLGEQHFAATKKRTISIIIPAYLPNEKDIIIGTLEHAIRKIECDRIVNICLVYNTPKPISEIEVELLNYHKNVINNRKIYVIKNQNSTSKSQNLNYSIAYLNHHDDLGDYTYIIDADHHPDADCLQILIAKMETNPKIDCVHGATYIREIDDSDHPLLARMVDAEFFIFYNLLFPAVSNMTGNAFFGGSNGLWRTPSLQMFDNNMLTEDIDMSIRSLMGRRKIVPEYRARSGELIPAGLKAIYTQRVRWAIGWNEVTFKYFRTLCCLSCFHISFQRFFGLIYVMCFRFFTILFVVLTSVFSAYDFFGDEPLWWFHMLNCTGFMIAAYLLTFLRFGITTKNLTWKQTIDRFNCAVILVAVSISLMIWNFFLDVVAIYRIITRKDLKWVITNRADTTLPMPNNKANPKEVVIED